MEVGEGERVRVEVGECPYCRAFAGEAIRRPRRAAVPPALLVRCGGDMSGQLSENERGGHLRPMCPPRSPDGFSPPPGGIAPFARRRPVRRSLQLLRRSILSKVGPTSRIF